MDNRSLISKLQTFLIILAAVLMLVSCLRPSAATPDGTALASAPVTTDSLSPEISEEPLSTFYVPASETIDVRPVPKPDESTDMPVDLPKYVPADPVMEMVSSLSDEELIGQMVMCGFSGVSSPSSDFLAFMEKYKVGNVILFGDNIETDEQTRKLTSVLNEHNPVKDIPLFISTDLEGGSVRRFNSWKPNILSAKRLYQKDDPEFTYEQFLRISGRLKECGINMNLAPVLDMSKNQDATFLGTRIFGGDPERVSEQANAAVAGIKDGGVVSIGKHYPGHGGSNEDSHARTPVINSTLEEMNGYELIPFRSAVENGIDGILVGHLLYPEVDGEIASVSHRFITEILREDMGFDGLVMSDDMRMGGITGKYSAGEAAVRFIEAGGDMVLIGKRAGLQEQVFESIYEALDSGRITRERLEESALRILRLKFSLKDGI